MVMPSLLTIVLVLCFMVLHTLAIGSAVCMNLAKVMQGRSRFNSADLEAMKNQSPRIYQIIYLVLLISSIVVLGFAFVV